MVFSELVKMSVKSCGNIVSVPLFKDLRYQR